MPLRSEASVMCWSKSTGVDTADGSFSCTPWMTLNTIAQSSMVRQMGPTRSWDHASVIAPERLTRPNVGRNALAPQRSAGETMDPCVAVPMANATQPPTDSDAGPADDPLDPCDRFH